jgi:imidazolonepropionase-like amidohydrolase
MNKILLSLLGLFCMPIFAQKGTCFYNANIHTGTGVYVEKGTLCIDKGKINYYGIQPEKLPAGSIDLQKKHIYPGIIALNTTLGIKEIDMVKQSNDFQEIGQLNPEVRSLTGFNCESRVLESVKSNGILLVQSSPRGNLISGQSSIFKTNCLNWEDGVVNADDALHLKWPEMPDTAQYRNKRAAQNAVEQYKKAKDLMMNYFADAYTYFLTKEKQVNLKLKAAEKLFQGKSAIFIQLNRSKSVVEAIEFCKKYAIKKVVLVGGEILIENAGFINRNNVMVVLDRLHALPENHDDISFSKYQLAAKAYELKMTYALNYDGDMEAMGQRNLPYLAGTSVAYGVPYEEAVKSITLNAAKIAGIDQYYGSIEIGKSATFIVTEGDFLDMKSSIVYSLYLDGKQIDKSNFQEKLFEKYK